MDTTTAQVCVDCLIDVRLVCVCVCVCVCGGYEPCEGRACDRYECSVK